MVGLGIMNDFIQPGFDFLIESCKRKYVYLKYKFLNEFKFILPVTQSQQPT